MTLRNRFYNWSHGVKRLRRKGCRNVGVPYPDYPQEEVIVKYDWSKPFKYLSKRYTIKELLLSPYEI